jgi:hypothetical protein
MINVEIRNKANTKLASWESAAAPFRGLGLAIGTAVGANSDLGFGAAGVR